METDRYTAKWIHLLTCFVQSSGTPDSITKDMVNCGEFSGENVQLNDQETEERQELKTSCSIYPNSQQFAHQH